MKGNKYNFIILQRAARNSYDTGNYQTNIYDETIYRVMSERESICTRGKSLSWRERVVKKEDKIFIFHCGQAVPILGGGTY